MFCIYNNQERGSQYKRFEGQSQSRLFPKSALLVPGYTIGANVGIKLKCLTSYCADKLHFAKIGQLKTNGRTERQRRTEMTTIPLRPLRPRGKKRTSYCNVECNGALCRNIYCYFMKVRPAAQLLYRLNYSD